MKLESICIISGEYPTKERMVYVFVQQLAEALVDDGVKISVVAPQSLVKCLVRGVKLLPKHMIYHTSLGNAYDVYRPYSLSFGLGNKALYRLAGSFNKKRINKCLEKISPQVVYGHFWHNARRGMWYTTTYGVPLFVACGEGDDALDNWASVLTKEQRERIRKRVAGVISVSTENKRKCLNYEISTEDNTIVLPNCVNEKVFFPQNSNDLRKQLGAGENDFVVCFTGSFTERKGYNRLAQAVDSLNDDNIKVIFCGAPMPGFENEKPHCKGIIHCGAINHDDLPRFLSASDVFVLPTLKEGCCNAIVEALACGVPVISSNRPFNDDILNDTNSIRINPEDVEEIAAAISKLKTDKELYGRLKKNALMNSSNYSIITRAKKVRTFIESKLN